MGILPVRRKVHAEWHQEHQLSGAVAMEREGSVNHLRARLLVMLTKFSERTSQQLPQLLRLYILIPFGVSRC